MLICDLSILNKYGKHALDKCLNASGFSWQEMVVMMVLQENPATDHTLVSKLLQTDKGNVTKLLNSMEKKDLIMRRVCESDGRCKDISLTQAGEAQLPALQEAMARWETELYQGLSPEQISAYSKISALIIANMLKIDQS